MAVFAGRDFSLPLGGRTYIMGILNVTPDSFSDGGRYCTVEDAVARARQIEEEGADILDIGAQSTRPGYQQISEKEELSRLLPVLEAVREAVRLPISVDTFFPEVARQAMLAGANILNDVSGFEESGMIRVAAYFDAGCVLMHPGAASYPRGVVREVRDYLKKGADRLRLGGVSPDRICLDPGIGFGKDMDDCLTLLRCTRETRVPDYAYLVGASRKRVVGYPVGNPPFRDRMPGTIAAHTLCQQGGADILRVHDVAAAVQAARVADAVLYGMPQD